MFSRQLSGSVRFGNLYDALGGIGVYFHDGHRVSSFGRKTGRAIYQCELSRFEQVFASFVVWPSLREEGAENCGKVLAKRAVAASNEKSRSPMCERLVDDSLYVQ